MVVRCVQSDSVFYPPTNITILLEGHLIQTVAAILDTLPASVLLGTDVREFGQLLGTRSVASPKDLLSEQQALATTTRARARDDARKEQEEHSREQECGVSATPVEPVQLTVLEVGSWGTNGVIVSSRTRLTRRQKRQGRREHKAMEEAAEMTSPALVIDVLKISALELRAHQEADPTLVAARGLRNGGRKKGR